MSKTFLMIDGDLAFDVNGRIVTIEGEEKVQQDIAEVLLTNFDGDRSFGCELNAIFNNPSRNYSEGQISTFVMDAIERLRAQQRTNPYTTSDEEIAMIDSIQVFKNDQTEVTFGLSVITSEGNAPNTILRLAPKPVSLNHLLPPSTSEQVQESSLPGLVNKFIGDNG